MEAGVALHGHLHLCVVEKGNIVSGEGIEVGDLHILVDSGGRGRGGDEGRNGDVGVWGSADKGERGVEGVELGMIGTGAGDGAYLMEMEG